MRDGLYLIMRRIDIFKRVSRFIANSRKAKDAEVTKMVNERILAEGDILNATELNDVSRVCKDGTTRLLNTAAVSDIDMVCVVNTLSNEAAESKQDIE